MQQIPNYLNARQKLFCHWFALTRDAQGAADRCFRAPEKREEALRLLQTPLAQDYLRQVEAALGGEGLSATAEEGYRRLAFGPVTDAVRLMFPAEDETPPLEEMDLYNISKISQAKGGLEITFFDRLEALDRLERAILRQRLGVAPEEFFLLSVGELNQNKNHQVVLEALSRLKRRGCLEGIRYGICGEGFARPQLEEEIRARGLSQVVTLYGYRPDIPQMVGCADATVFPSRREGLGMAGLESLAMGVPVLAADNRGTREYMSFGKNGLLYPWDDPAGFARGIALLRGMDPRRRELLSQRCVASVAPFDRTCSQAVMQAVYQEMERKVRERCEQKTLGHRADGLL